VASVSLFDFFGTSAMPRRNSLQFPSWSRISFSTPLGVELTYEEYFARWEATSARFDRSARDEHLEYSMTTLAKSFRVECLDEAAAARVTDSYVDVFLAEWDAAVPEIEGIDGVIESLARTFRLAIVSNTNDPRLVPSRLERLGISE
jgi:putative hydrolase of the HAD superfamily